jgi:hypothetical protein
VRIESKEKVSMEYLRWSEHGVPGLSEHGVPGHGVPRMGEQGVPGMNKVYLGWVSTECLRWVSTEYLGWVTVNLIFEISVLAQHSEDGIKNVNQEFHYLLAIDWKGEGVSRSLYGVRER